MTTLGLFGPSACSKMTTAALHKGSASAYLPATLYNFHIAFGVITNSSKYSEHHRLSWLHYSLPVCTMLLRSMLCLSIYPRHAQTRMCGHMHG